MKRFFALLLIIALLCLLSAGLFACDENGQAVTLSKEELALAREHNVSIYDGYIPVACTSSGVVTFKHRKMDASIKFKADLIVLAVGQEAEPLEGMQLERGETPVRVGDIFYTGDLVAGDKTVVNAVRKGKLVALDVCKFLGVDA